MCCFDTLAVAEVKEERMVKVFKKGGSVLDQWIPDDIKAKYHVFQKASIVKYYLWLDCCKLIQCDNAG